MKVKTAGIAGVVLASLALSACSPQGTSTSPQSTNSSANQSQVSNHPGNSNKNQPAKSESAKNNLPAASTKPVTKVSGPLPGNLLIADRGNNRLMIVTPSKKIIWSMNIPVGGPHNQHSLGADDAFFTPDYKHIIVNEEDNQRIGVIDIATKKFTWTYGHPGAAGSAPGYLHTPDDAYMLKNGTVTVADIKNQRILYISPSGHVIKQLGTTGYRYHNPPYSFAAPNGDTPLSDGGVLVTEIGGSYADRINAQGHLVWSVHIPNMTYPSDTQMLPSGNLLVADYVTPGRLEIITPKGQVVWDYYKTSGPGELSNPSLAQALPNGNIVVNDDFNDRVVIIDPQTNKIVWQYGHTGVPGTGPGYLNVPDGMDFMPPSVSLPTKPTTKG
ncbi:hypothetical protein LLE49_16645 [Alicyclobacillus tolerans]|uniref:hypothetical protein n=1 Tax=Alicyclobacillus tolerans TaxID=90970 RepID=UPI001F2EF26C|nr:hypothetical protein [Alicyclobacillus tolerans]MCF8566352.1 hypothetical protein [Alicyclobacillus tolerans]